MICLHFADSYCNKVAWASPQANNYVYGTCAWDANNEGCYEATETIVLSRASNAGRGSEEKPSLTTCDCKSKLSNIVPKILLLSRIFCRHFIICVHISLFCSFRTQRPMLPRKKRKGLCRRTVVQQQLAL